MDDSFLELVLFVLRLIAFTDWKLESQIETLNQYLGLKTRDEPPLKKGGDLLVLGTEIILFLGVREETTSAPYIRLFLCEICACHIIKEVSISFLWEKFGWC